MALFTNEVEANGPLTDTQIRATPLPVSGTVSTGGLTDTQLRATPVPVSGPLTDTQIRATPLPVSGPLTDTQLRATPVPISGTVTATVSPLTASAATVTSVSVTAASTTLSASTPARKGIIIFNETGTLFVKFGTAASSTSYTYRLTANTVLELTDGCIYTGLITAIKASGTSNVLVTEL